MRVIPSAPVLSFATLTTLTTLATLAAIASSIGVVACSSESSATPSSCATNPFSCPAGQTCSAKDTGGTFACLPSGAGKKGDACQNTPGATTCGDTLVCLQTSRAGGQCSPFCEEGSGTAHACAATAQCRAAALQGTTTVFHVCVDEPGPPADAGAE